MCNFAMFDQVTVMDYKPSSIKLTEVIESHVVSKQETAVVAMVTDSYGFLEVAGQANQVFFYYSDLIGCHISELSVGSILEFDLIFRESSKRYCAINVKIPEPEAMETETDPNCNVTIIGAVKYGMFDKMLSCNKQATAGYRNQRGRISEISVDYGFIDYGKHGVDHVFFHYTELIGCHLTEMYVGQDLQFDFIDDSGCCYAANVTVAEPETKTERGCFGTIASVTKSFGFLDYTINGTTLQVFFHNRGSCLKFGDKVKFTLVSQAGQFLTENLSIFYQQTAIDVEKRPSNLAESIAKMNLQPEILPLNTGMFEKSNMPAIVTPGKIITGVITQIFQDYGFMTSKEVNGDIFLHYTELIGCHMSEFTVGSVVECELVNKARACGKNIRKRQSIAKDKKKNAGILNLKHFLQLESQKLEVKRLSRGSTISSANSRRGSTISSLLELPTSPTTFRKASAGEILFGLQDRALGHL